MAEGTLSSTLIPFLKDEIVNGNKLSFQKFRNDIFSLTIILLFFVSYIFFFFSESFIKIFASGFTDENIKLSSEMLQIMSPFLFFISLSAFNMGLLNSKSKFFAPAFSPTIFNLSVILSLILSFYFFDLNIIHLSYAVLLGAIGQFLFQLPYIYKNDLNYSLSLTNLINSKTKNFLLLLGPQVLGLGIYNINILINTQFASFMEDGSITYLYLSERLLEFPLGVFAVSIAVTSMTKFSEFSAKNETQQISKYLSERMKFLFYLLAPCSAIFIFWGQDICSLLFERGEFSYTDSLNTSKALLAYSLGLIFVGAIRLLTQAYYSRKNTKIPFKLSVYNLFFNLFFCFLFSIQFNMGFFGLALASSISAFILFLSLLFNLMQENIDLDFKNIIIFLIKIILLCISVIYLTDFILIFFKTINIGNFLILLKIFIFLLIFISVSYLLKIREFFLIKE